MLTFDQVVFKRNGFQLSADVSIAGRGVTAVIGPSGGGKSTFLSLIAGFDLPDAGQVRWAGQDLGPHPPGDRPVAVLFQDNNLFPHLDVLTNVALGASPLARSSEDAKTRARQALARVGLAGLEDRLPGALSGGQQSRAALARILLTDRAVVLMDEAFSALGPALRVEMLDLVKELLSDRVILMVTHDPEDARRMAEQTIFVAEGAIFDPVETDALFANPPQALADYLA